jgi:hypothetical protein
MLMEIAARLSIRCVEEVLGETEFAVRRVTRCGDRCLFACESICSPAAYYLQIAAAAARREVSAHEVMGLSMREETDILQRRSNHDGQRFTPFGRNGHGQAALADSDRCLQRGEEH